MKLNTVAVSALIINTLIETSFFATAHFLTYEDARKSVLLAEDLLTTGGRIKLTAKETLVDDRLVKEKLEELSRGFRNPAVNAAALHFFKAKQLIERGNVFKFLRQMPKGAILHAHNTASVSSEWMVRNISYMPGLLRCTNSAGVSVLTFRQAPRIHDCQTQYVRVSEERRRSVSSSTYDLNFEKMFNLQTPTPELEYPSLTSVWTKFQDMFTTIHDALRYIPAYQAYHWQMLQEMYEDNVMYGEVRMDFRELYDSTGQIFPPERSVEEILHTIREFCHLHPDFLGIKAIFSTNRGANQSRVREQFEKFKMLHYKYPNFIIGFDLVGQEDKGSPLHNFIEVLTDLPKTARYFFHAGETNWYGASTDLNLLDAILLNTTRIGHGYALSKHPVLWNAVKTRDIAIEVSPISNQVLHLVWDLRNHPAAIFMSQNLPIVISNDDPGFWNAKGLAYDFYYAFMSLAPNHVGLKTLKNLVWNSIRYSVLNDAERRRAFAILERAWNNFLDDTLQGLVF